MSAPYQSPKLMDIFSIFVATEGVHPSQYPYVCTKIRTLWKAKMNCLKLTQAF